MKTFRKSPLLRFSVIAILALLFVPLVAFAFSSPGALMLTTLGITGTLNMLDLARANSSEVVVPLIEEAVTAHPELQHFPANQLGAGELSYQSLVRTGYPSAGFHDMGAGHTPSKSTTKLQRFEVFPFGGRVQAPKHVADNWKRGGASGYFSFEALGIMKAAMFAICRQIWYGRAADGKGFPGLKNFTAFGTSVTDPISGKTYLKCINAGGTTANTGSSCYLVKFGEDAIELQFGTGSVFDLPEPRIADYQDPNDSAKTIEGYVSVLQGFAGLQTANIHSVVRIANLTNDSGKGMTDAKLALALKQFPQGHRPDAIFMSADQRYLLQISRTVALMGQGNQRPDQPTVAPLPTEYDGIPIYATDAIGDTDAIEVAALAEE